MAAATPTVVLVHGAWADATGFDAELRALQARGFRAIGFANPGRACCSAWPPRARSTRSANASCTLLGTSRGLPHLPAPTSYMGVRRS